MSTKKTKTPAPITSEQREALRKWANYHGGTWKAKLSKAWMSAGSSCGYYAPELQQLRNQHGPSWLNLVNSDLSNVTVKEASGAE